MVDGPAGLELARLNEGDVLAAALVYAELGWPVLPVAGMVSGTCGCRARARCKHPAKHYDATEVIDIMAWPQEDGRSSSLFLASAGTISIRVALPPSLCGLDGKSVLNSVEPVGRKMWVVVLLDAEGEPTIPGRKEGMRDSRVEAIWQAWALADKR